MQTHRPQHGPRGYTLMEVLMALIIAVFVFVSICALLPAAIWMQRQAHADLRAQMTARSAAALLHGCRYPLVDLDGALPKASTDLFDPVNGLGLLKAIPSNPPATSRSEPSFLPVNQRSYYWHPLVRRDRPLPEQSTGPLANADEFEVLVLVMRRDRGQADPTNGVKKALVTAANTSTGSGVVSTFSATGGATFTPTVIPGDVVVASNGVCYQVKSFAPTVITVQTPIIGTNEPAATGTGKMPTALWYWPALPMTPSDSVTDDGPPRVTRGETLRDVVE